MPRPRCSLSRPVLETIGSNSVGRAPCKGGAVLRIGAPQGLARDRVTAQTDKQLQLGLGDLVALVDETTTESGESPAQPSTRRRSLFGVVPGERSRHRAVAVADGDRAQQALVAVPGTHHPHRLP